MNNEYREIIRKNTVNSLNSTYQNYAIGNKIREIEVRKRIQSRSKRISTYYYLFSLDQINYTLLRALNTNANFQLRILVESPWEAEYLRLQGFDADLVHCKRPKNTWRDAADTFEPDICFSEMPYGTFPEFEKFLTPEMTDGNWLPRYSDIFSLGALRSSLFCLVHYAYILAAKTKWLNIDPSLSIHYSLPYPNRAWRFFLESSAHEEWATSENIAGNIENYTVSGYPKYDFYMVPPKTVGGFSWRFGSERKRIIYAPHWYRSNDTMQATCEYLITLADSGAYEVVFKPHPVPNSTAEQLAQRMATHPAIQVVRNSLDAQFIYATADFAVISSVSMHADGLFSGIPYASELGEQHFNHIGLEFKRAGYDGYNIEQIQTALSDVLVNGTDRLRPNREHLQLKYRSPHGGASAWILRHIENALL